MAEIFSELDVALCLLSCPKRGESSPVHHNRVSLQPKCCHFNGRAAICFFVDLYRGIISYKRPSSAISELRRCESVAENLALLSQSETREAYQATLNFQFCRRVESKEVLKDVTQNTCFST